VDVFKVRGRAVDKCQESTKRFVDIHDVREFAIIRVIPRAFGITSLEA
jgi:hypothetical protein